jgi:hypothetical protein
MYYTVLTEANSRLLYQDYPQVCQNPKVHHSVHKTGLCPKPYEYTLACSNYLKLILVLHSHLLQGLQSSLFRLNFVCLPR